MKNLAAQKFVNLGKEKSEYLNPARTRLMIFLSWSADTKFVASGRDAEKVSNAIGILRVI